MQKLSRGYRIMLLLAISLTTLWAFEELFFPKLFSLPKDICYYETHHAPDWVNKYFLDFGHLEETGNLYTHFLVFIAAIVLTITVELTFYRFKGRKTGK